MTGAALSTGCTEAGGTEVAEVEQELGGGGSVSQGAVLFSNKNKGATFGGNGRTCRSCHPSDNAESGTLSPADVDDLFQTNPESELFQHDAADVMGGNTFDRVRSHATILVEIPLPPNVSIAGSSARSVTLARGIPTVKNTPALDPVLMYDGRAPNLQEQARGAIAGHAQSTSVTSGQLDSIAVYQQTLFNRQNLEFFAEEGIPLTLPMGETEEEIRGRRFFIADNTSNPELVGESPAQRCGWCHSGEMLNEISGFFSTNVAGPRGFPAPEGHRFFTAGVSQINLMGNPTYDFLFALPDGRVFPLTSPDPGRALITGMPFDGDMFKIGTLWGAEDTAPYFHDNSADSFEELMFQYDIFFSFLGLPPLTEQNKSDIIAYLKIL